jgi:hypothetical protein
MNMKRHNLGPWLLGAVAIICATVLVITGHEDSVGAGIGFAVLMGMLLFFAGFFHRE